MSRSKPFIRFQTAFAHHGDRPFRGVPGRSGVRGRSHRGSSRKLLRTITQNKVRVNLLTF